MRRARHRLGGVLQWQPDIDRRPRPAIRKRARIVGRRQDLKHAEVRAALHDADHRELPIVEPHRPSHDRRIASERARPQSFADHRHGRTTRPRLLGREPTAGQRPHAEHRQQLVGHRQCLQPDRFTGLRRVVHFAAGKGRDCRHSLAPLLVVEIVGQRRRLTRRARIAVRLPHHGQRVDVLDRRGPQQHRVDHAEDRRIRPDPQRHRQQRDDGEARVAGEQPESIAKVLTKHERAP